MYWSLKKVKSSFMKAICIPPFRPIELFVGTRLKRYPRHTLDCAYSDTREPVNRARMIPSKIAERRDVNSDDLSCQRLRFTIFFIPRSDGMKKRLKTGCEHRSLLIKLINFIAMVQLRRRMMEIDSWCLSDICLNRLNVRIDGMSNILPRGNIKYILRDYLLRVWWRCFEESDVIELTLVIPVEKELGACWSSMFVNFSYDSFIGIPDMRKSRMDSSSHDTR